MTTPPADRAAPVAYLAMPKTLQERLRWLELDAARIVRDPTSHAPEVVQWASDMLAAHAGSAKGVRHGRA